MAKIDKKTDKKAKSTSTKVDKKAAKPAKTAIHPEPISSKAILEKASVCLIYKVFTAKIPHFVSEKVKGQSTR